MNNLIINILEYIDNSLYSKISIDDLSRIFYFNKDYIMRVFKKELGLTIIDYINKKRIFNSLDDLGKTDNYILKIAIKHGFASQEYYSEIFTKITGVNPLTYRKFNNPNTTISYEEISTIRKNLTDLKYQLDKISKYRCNIPKETVKRLSIYK